MATRGLGNLSSTFSLFRNLSTHFGPHRFSSSSASDSFEKYVLTRCKSRDLSVSEALWLFDSTLKVEPFPSILTLNNLFASLLKMGQCFTVLSMYAHLTRSYFVDFCPDVYTLNIVVKCFSETNNVKSGFCVLGTMVKSGLDHDSYTLNTLLHLLCKRRSMAAAAELFERIEKDEDLRDPSTLGAMVDGLCKAGEPRKALVLLKRALEGGGPRPDGRCFGPVVDRLSKDGLVDEAACVFQTMIGCGIPPGDVLYNSLILGLTRSRRWDQVAEILEDMKARGVSPDAVTLGAVLDARFKEGSTVEALRLVGVMAERGLLPVSLASCCFPHGSPGTEEVQIFSGTAVKGGGGVADAYVLNIILNGLASGFMMLECRSLFDEMIKLGVADRVSFTTVINGYCLQGEMDKAEEVFDTMERSGFLPCSVTLYVLANGYLRNGRLADAFAFFKDLVVLRGLRPNKSTRKILKTILAYKREAVLSTTLDKKTTLPF